MLRKSLLAVSLFLSACGVDPAEPAVQEAAILEAQPSKAVPTERLELTELTPKLRLEDELVPAMEVVSVHSLAVPDGTQVRYLLGMLGCGISVVASGTASAQGGAFEVPYDPGMAVYGQLSLFLQIDEEGTGVCDPETSQVYEVQATLPGSVDLSTLPEQSFIGCWLFDN